MSTKRHAKMFWWFPSMTPPSAPKFVKTMLLIQLALCNCLCSPTRTQIGNKTSWIKPIWRLLSLQLSIMLHRLVLWATPFRQLSKWLPKPMAAPAKPNATTRSLHTCSGVKEKSLKTNSSHKLSLQASSLAQTQKQSAISNSAQMTLISYLWSQKSWTTCPNSIWL